MDVYVLTVRAERFLSHVVMEGVHDLFVVGVELGQCYERSLSPTMAHPPKLSPGGPANAPTSAADSRDRIDEIIARLRRGEDSLSPGFRRHLAAERRGREAKIRPDG
ncbi:MAG: hypothetical protein AABM42_00815 [Actinomycetota bacterium]